MVIAKVLVATAEAVVTVIATVTVVAAAVVIGQNELRINYHT